MKNRGLPESTRNWDAERSKSWAPRPDIAEKEWHLECFAPGTSQKPPDSTVTIVIIVTIVTSGPQNISERLGPGVPTPVASITRRSNPTPKPAWGTEPKRPSWGQADGDSEDEWLNDHHKLRVDPCISGPTLWIFGIGRFKTKPKGKTGWKWMNTGQHPEALYENVFMTQPNLKDTGLLDAVGCCWATPTYTNSTGFRTKVPVPPIVFFWKTQPRPSAASRTTTNDKNWKLQHTVGLEMTWGENGRKSAVVWRCLASLRVPLENWERDDPNHTATGKTSVSARCWKPVCLLNGKAALF